MEELLNQLQHKFKNIQDSAWELSDLEETLELSRNLHERLIVLKYKALERQLENKKHEETASQEPISERMEAPDDISFDLFSEQTQEPEMIFGSEEELVESQTTPSQDEETESIEEDPVSSESIEALDHSTRASIESTETEHKEISNLPEEDHNWMNFFGRAVQDGQSGIKTHLTSLSGSFGLNERLLYINELFGGDADAFSQTVKDLDQLSTWEIALSELSKIALQFGWDHEKDTPGDFAVHVHRKFN